MQEFAGVIHHGTPQAREIFVWLLAEIVVLSPELRSPTVDVSGRIVGVEVVEVVLGEGLLGTVPHEASHPRDEDVADGVWIDSVHLGLVLNLVGLLGDACLEVDVIEILMSGLKRNIGVGRGSGVGCSGGDGRGACVKGGITWARERKLDL